MIVIIINTPASVILRMLFETQLKNLRKAAAKTKDAVIGIVKREEGSGRDAYIPLTREEILSELNTRETGLVDKEAIHRLAVVGPNILKRVARKHLLYFFYLYFSWIMCSLVIKPMVLKDLLD